jgi:deoxyribonuclease V
MGVTDLHPWNLDPDQAIKLQAGLRERLVLAWDGREITTVGGVDVSFQEGCARAIRAAIVVLSYPDLAPLEGLTADASLVFPYIPGLLAFREGPAILAAWEKLRIRPDLLMIHGHGIAHPRGIGIASHMGLWLERPTIGVAKSRLYGRHTDPGPLRGDRLPLYVSPGHLIDVDRSGELVLQCSTRYRLPEPVRWAHRVAGGEKLPD